MLTVAKVTRTLGSVPTRIKIEMDDGLSGAIPYEDLNGVMSMHAPGGAWINNPSLDGDRHTCWLWILGRPRVPSLHEAGGKPGTRPHGPAAKVLVVGYFPPVPPRPVPIRLQRQSQQLIDVLLYCRIVPKHLVNVFPVR